MKKEKDGVKDFVDSIITPIFDKVLQETSKNPMSVGEVGKKNNKFCFYNPHNYRLYIDFDKRNIDLRKLNNLPKPTIDRSVVTTHRLKNSKEHEIDNFMNCTITIKKTQVEIRNKINIEKVYRLELVANSKSRFYEIVEEKNNECISVLKKFIEEYKGKSNFDILRVWCENKIWNEDAIDLIPIKARWHSPISKKVYNEPNVEFTDPAFASNYIDTRAIESVAPDIATSIKYQNLLLEKSIEVQNNTVKEIEYLAKNINTHIPAVERLGESSQTLAGEVINLNMGVNKLIKTVDMITDTLIKKKPKIKAKKRNHGLTNNEMNIIRNMKL